MKNKKLWVLSLWISCFFLIVKAEGISSFSFPPTPEAAALGKYGQYPVALYNGLVNINIPIYEIEIKGYSLPISINYHASGIKVDEISTPVGLGWVLNAGGVITRSVKGRPDLNFGASGVIVYDQQGTSILSHGDKQQYLLDMYNGEVSGALDLESDVYYYNFGGMSGSFRYDIRGNLIQIPLTNNKIEFDGTFFRITGNDGTVYAFRDREKSYFEYRAVQTEYVSSWYLSYIETKEGNLIEFEYMTDSTIYYDPYVTYSLRVFHSSPLPSLGLEATCLKRRVDNTLHLKSIKFPGGAVYFTYNGDRIDRRKYRLTKIEITNNKSFILEQDYFGSSRLRLNTIKMIEASGVSIGKYSFDYENSSLLPPYLNASSPIPPYSNGLNQLFFGQDQWGYYNGVTTNKNLFTYDRAQTGYNIGEVQANRSVNFNFTQACALKKITYPTGGYTIFNYEGNKNYLEEDLGGLRIKNVISYINDSNPPTVQSYEYSIGRHNRPGIAKTQGYSYSQGDVRNGIKYIYDYYISEPSVPLSHVGGSSVYYQHVIEYNGYPQNSSGKTEYSFLYTSNDIHYQYPFPYYLPNESSLKFIPKFEYGFIDRGRTRGYPISIVQFARTDEGFIKKKRTNYTYNIFKQQRYVVGFKPFSNYWPNLPSQSMTNGRYTPPPEELFQYTDIIAETGLLKLTAVIDSTFSEGESITQSITHFYHRLDNQYEITATHQKNSDGSIRKKSYTYPNDINFGIYRNMFDRNILSPVILTTDSVDNNFLKETQINYSSWSNTIIAPSNIQERIGTGNSETRIIYHNYDLRGNPLYISDDNSKNVVYIWGYNYRYLIAQIENATYSQVVQALPGGENTIKSLASSANPDISVINALRTSLPGASVTTYTYKPAVGILTKTEPHGVVKKYEYDLSGRLIYITDSQNKIIKSFVYQYMNK
jgi:YD repeat-containing protein